MGNLFSSPRDDEEFSKITEEDPNMPGRRKRKHEVKTPQRNPLQEEYENIRKQHEDLNQKYERQVNELNQKETEVKNLSEDNARKVNELNKNYQEEIASLRNQITRSEEMLDQTKQQLESKTQELEKKKDEVESLRTRLSTLAAANITSNNPNIANLSDSHRPTKLAEQYSQFYDNDWTDSICELEDVGIKDREAIEILRDQIVDLYKLCKTKADQQTNNLLHTLTQFMLDTRLPDEMKNHLNDTRKTNYQKFLPELTKEMNDRLKSSKPEVLQATHAFRKKGLELCWLMCIQDPPIYMDYDVTSTGMPFDKAVYKEYTSTGQYVDYVVWPALYLYKGGTTLCKGAAQGRN